MTLIKDGLRGIVSGSEKGPVRADGGEVQVRYNSRKDKPLTTIVLGVEPDLLYFGRCQSNGSAEDMDGFD